MNRKRAPRMLFLAAAAVCSGLLCSCSINQLAVRTMGGFLAGSGESTVFTGDNDPELIRDAMPFAMKTYEALLESDPGNAPLALAAGRAFVSYSVAFVLTPADELPVEQVDRQQAMRLRAKSLCLRGRGYVLQGLEKRRPGFTAAIERGDTAGALRLVRPEDADYLYWTAAAWLAAFSADPFDFSLIVSVPRAVALLHQINTWNPSYDKGAVHEILISFYGAAPADLGGGEQKARASFERAVALSHGLRAGPYVALASTVSVKDQNIGEFRDLLHRALAIDVNADVPDRLVNVINQRRARWLLDHAEDFFLSEGGQQ